jgi:hypothetical protein
MTDARSCAAQALVEGGYLLAEDVELVVGQAT